MLQPAGAKMKAASVESHLNLMAAGRPTLAPRRCEVQSVSSPDSGDIGSGSFVFFGILGIDGALLSCSGGLFSGADFLGIIARPLRSCSSTGLFSGADFLGIILSPEPELSTGDAGPACRTLSLAGFLT